MFCDPLPLQLLSKNHLFPIFWNWVNLPPSYLNNVFKYTGIFLEYPFIIHAITRYFYTIIFFLLHTLKALGSRQLLRNQRFSNLGTYLRFFSCTVIVKKSIFMHWRKWVTNCYPVLKIRGGVIIKKWENFGVFPK